MVFRVLSTAFMRILLFAKCHNSALSNWHVFTVLLVYPTTVGQPNSLNCIMLVETTHLTQVE